MAWKAVKKGKELLTRWLKKQEDAQKENDKKDEEKSSGKEKGKKKGKGKEKLKSVNGLILRGLLLKRARAFFYYLYVI
jgi:hypothetical protein